jgi:serine/threonine-protein kinase
MTSPNVTEARRRAEAGDLLGAAELYERSGHFFEAAGLRQGAGDVRGALASLVRVSAGHPRYREACVLAIGLAHERAEISLPLENMLARFLRESPEAEREVEALVRLAEMYERQGFPENAAEIFKRLSIHRPEYAEAAARLGRSFLPAESELADLPPAPLPSAALLESTAKEPEVDPHQGEGSIFRSGGVVAGKYRLGERLGVGGMSVVFRAADMDLGDEIAIKVFTQAVIEPESDARLRRELMLSRQLVHRNIVRVFEMGMAQGLRYLTMELLVGSKLTDRLRGGPLALDEGLDYLAQTCAGLQAAHDQGVIHRDVKPGNLFIVQGGTVKVMDFGLAKMRHAPGLTVTGVIGGTAAYMAPEQAADFRSVTAAADIYALGVMAYELFTGLLPFRHDNPLSVLIMHRENTPAPPRSIHPELPLDLERMILGCLAKDPADRPASCRELAQRITTLRR